MPSDSYDIYNPSKSATAETDICPTWLRTQGVLCVMAGQKSSLIINMISIIPLYVLYTGEVNSLLLGLWCGLSLVLFGLRYFSVRVFLRKVDLLSQGEILQFYSKYIWACTATAVVWGCMAYMFYSYSHMHVQALGWVAIIAVGMVATTSFAAHKGTMLSFIAVMISTSIVCCIIKSASNTNPEFGNSNSLLLPILICIVFVIIVQGLNNHNAFINQKVLEYKNHALIRTLQEQTERAVTAIETKNRFLASAAHDIRQPVLALDLYTSMLSLDNGMVRQLTPKINVATRAVIEMFDSLFDLARIENGKIEIAKTTIDVENLMNELLTQYQPVAQVKGLELRFHSCNAKVHSDPVLLKRIIGNLVANAIKFTETKGVLLACRKTKYGVLFEVWDTGMGIPAEQQQAIFNEFYKVPVKNTKTTVTNDGFGLGLSIVTRFCDSLGHRFSMRSKLGKGSVFRVEVNEKTLA